MKQATGTQPETMTLLEFFNALDREIDRMQREKKTHDQLMKKYGRK